MEGGKRDFIKMQTLPLLNQVELASQYWVIDATFSCSHPCFQPF